MSLINVGTLPTQLQTILNGLDIPNEELTRIVTLLKTAIAAGADTSALVTQIESLIDTETGLNEIALLILATRLISEDMVISVPTLADLNNANIAPGSVFYVQEKNLPYVKKSDGTWVIIDPSLHAVQVENLYAWGSNSTGQIGDGSTVSKSSPVSVVGGFTDWVQVSGGNYHSLGIRANGSAWAWGSNNLGRLGTNNTTNRSSPVSVVGAFTDWVQVSGGFSHSLGVRANGSAWAWGANSYGRLGDGTTTSRSSPVSVVGGFTDWVQVSVGIHSLGLRANGTAWAWGANSYGNLGDGTTVEKSSPVSVVGGFTDWVQLAAGLRHSLGVRANGTAWAWGSNIFGQIGDNTTTGRSSPVSVIGGFTNWVQVSGGTSHSIGLRANGTTWAWGDNGSGRLGDGTTVASRLSPVSVIGGFTDWIQVAAGGNFNIAIRANGSAWAWGSNLRGQIGDGTTVAKSSPVSVIGGFTDWVEVAANYQSLGIRGSN